MALAIALNKPTAGQSDYPPGKSATVALEAAATGGSPTSVDFYVGTTKVATGANQGGGVWTATWIGAASGSWGVYAKANDGTVSPQHIISIRESTVGRPAYWNGDFDTGDYGQYEIGYQGLAAAWNNYTDLGNWPLGYIMDGTRVGAPGPRCIEIVRAADGAPVRAGAYSLKSFLRQGQAAYIGNGFDQNGGIDACWLVPGVATFPGATYPGTSTYKPGASRANLLPPDADIPGREVYWHFSFYYDSGFNNSGLFYAGGPDFHSDNSAAGSVSYTGFRLYNNRFLLTVRGSNTPGIPSPWYQVDYAFSTDGSYSQAVPFTGSGDPNFASKVNMTAWNQITDNTWYDILFRVLWSDNKSLGVVQAWMDVGATGVYKQVLPPYYTTTLYTFMQGGVPVSAGIRPYLGMYRSRSVATDSQMHIDQVRRGATAFDVMMPNSTMELAGTGVTAGGTTTPKADTLTDLFGSQAGSNAIWTPQIDAAFRPNGNRRRLPSPAGQPSRSYPRRQRRLTTTERRRLLARG